MATKSSKQKGARACSSKACSNSTKNCSGSARACSNNSSAEINDCGCGCGKDGKAGK